VPLHKLVEGYVAAADIMMQARYQVRNIAPLHEKLCRVSHYLDRQVAEILLESEGPYLYSG